MYWGLRISMKDDLTEGRFEEKREMWVEEDLWDEQGGGRRVRDEGGMEGGWKFGRDGGRRSRT